MNKNAKHKDLIDQTIINIKEKYPTMDTFLNLDYNTRFDVLHTIIETHEEGIIEATEEGKFIQLPFIGRLIIKDGKVLYNEIVEQYLLDNNLKSKKDLDDNDRLNIIMLMKKGKLEHNLLKDKHLVETSVRTFKLKC